MTQIVSCPVCKAPMKEIHWRHVAIDICTRCKGVWLDYGELDAIIETRQKTKNSGARNECVGAKDFFYLRRLVNAICIT